jgi:aspartyl-tRNA(Asn)/glutamyl-tRNA(Gln) amidotransferase subunit C
MIDVNESLIRKVADLARLELNDEEIAHYSKSIGEILNHVDQLSAVHTDGVEPMVYGIDDSLRLRPDEVVDFGLDEKGQPKILTHAPDVLHDGFKVPQIVG